MIHSKQYLLKRAVGTEVLHMSERLIERLSEEKDADMNRVMEIFEEEKVHCFGLEFVADKIVFNGFPMEAESTISFAELTCMMAERAKEMKWINPAETIEANEKYYMRIWLIRLGLGGKGGKKTRDLLLKNLKGKIEDLQWMPKEGVWLENSQLSTSGNQFFVEKLSLDEKSVLSIKNTGITNYGTARLVM